ncbi:MAG: exodeoxyribonuclease VII large subunit [Candidatus Eisenbacteria bacterium]
MRPIDDAIEKEKVYSVSEITSCIKDAVESEFPRVWVVGEVSNCKAHSSGHTYFTLKDDGAQIRCVLFSGSSRHLSVLPENGLKIYARGRVTVYERQGQYELIVTTILPTGKGELYIAFNELKEKLAKEGLFDPERKRPIPRFPSRIAVVTSPTGAAVRDVIRAATKIHQGVEIVVYPVRVQGEGARDEISQALADLNSLGGFDVIILARGGGSIEDLWAFNEEIVARAISDSEIPVVSAVGHEIDYTIADFVADARAPTPSAAPALVLVDYVDVKTRLSSLMQQARSQVSAVIERHTQFLTGLKSHYGLRSMTDRLTGHARDIDEMLMRAETWVVSRTDAEAARLSRLEGEFQALSPTATLERGYSICFHGDTRKIVRSYSDIDVGDSVSIRFAEGGAVSRVEKRGKELT